MENFLTFLVALAIFQVNADSGYEQFDYSAEALETAVKEGAHFVLLYANEELCPECAGVRATIHELMGEYNTAEDRKVTIGELDCTTNVDFCKKVELKTYPEFHFFPSGDGKTIKYIGDVKKADLKTFIDEQSAPASKATVEPKNGLYELTQDTFKSFVAEGHHFIKFYAPWCGHCKKLAPTWDELAKGFENSEDVKISKIDCTAHTEVCRGHGIRGYPTLKFFSAGEDVESYKGARSHDELKKFVTEQVQKRNAPPQEEEEAAADSTSEEVKAAVRELTDKDFDDVIGSGVTFVKFYAPWCGHCKRLAPTWEELAKDVSSMTGVSIAKIDCTKYKEVCSDNEVRGYPTLYLFSDGERKPKYSGGRDLASLKAYVSGEFKKDEL